jgi:NitT/TauT family transport system ATP-binding protein
MTTRLKLISSGPESLVEPPVLEISRLKMVFRVNNTYLNVLESIDFSAKQGEFICILGRSGCGKTTLLKIAAGFISPSSGAVRIGGKTVTSPGPDRCVVFQEDALFPWLTVEENIAFGLKGMISNKKAIRKEVDRFLSLVGLTPFRSYLPREISGGMKQRVALARVLILQPQVLLMDEPFAALDAQTREEMQGLLLDLWDKFHHTILFVTHDVAEAVTLSDRILVMDKDPGKIREDIFVKLPRPRIKDQPAFLFVYRQLYEGLKKE